MQVVQVHCPRCSQALNVAFHESMTQAVAIGCLCSWQGLCMPPQGKEKQDVGNRDSRGPSIPAGDVDAGEPDSHTE